MNGDGVADVFIVGPGARGSQTIQVILMNVMR